MRDRKYVTRLLALIVSTCEFQKGLGHGPERAWVRVPKGPGSRGNWVTWPRYEFQKGLGHGPERAWVRVPKGPESRP